MKMLKEFLTIAGLVTIAFACVFALIYYINNGYTFKKKSWIWHKFDNPKHYKTDLDQNDTFKSDSNWFNGIGSYLEMEEKPFTNTFTPRKLTPEEYDIINPIGITRSRWSIGNGYFEFSDRTGRIRIEDNKVTIFKNDGEETTIDLSSIGYEIKIRKL